MKHRLHLLLLRARNRALLILIQLDILLFVTFGGGQRNETISACAFAMEQAGQWQGRLARPLIDALMWPVERDHCHQAWLAERNKY